MPASQKTESPDEISTARSSRTSIPWVFRGLRTPSKLYHQSWLPSTAQIPRGASRFPNTGAIRTGGTRAPPTTPWTTKSPSRTMKIGIGSIGQRNDPLKLVDAVVGRADVEVGEGRHTEPGQLPRPSGKAQFILSNDE